jgi:hypothetical protein
MGFDRIPKEEEPMRPTTKKPEPDTVRTTLVLDRETWRQLRYRAADTDTNLQAVMTAAIQAYLKAPPKKEPK